MHPLLNPEQTTLLLLGNEAVVRGALEAGIGCFATYPGTPASEIGDTFAALQREAGVFFEYSINEKVALETVIAFSLSGWRAMAAMKHVGLNVAADAFMTFPYLGTDAGAVIVTADDPGCHSSQNEQDNRYFAKMAGTPMLEPADPAEACYLCRVAFEWSEKLALPVLFRLTTRVAHMRGPVTLGPLPLIPVAKRYFKRDPMSRVVVPAVARRRHAALLERLEAARLAAEMRDFHKVRLALGAEYGIVATGASRNLVRDALLDLGLEDSVSLLEFSWTWPQPRETIAEFLRGCRRVLVVEEGAPFQEEAIAAIAQRAQVPVTLLGKATGHFRENGELDPDKVRAAILDLVGKAKVAGIGKEQTVPFEIPGRPPTLCAGCPHRAAYVLARQVAGPDTIVATDIGCYTLGLNPPLGMGDLLVCMGSSVSTGAALAAAQGNAVLAVIGDSTFFHAGIPALINAVTYNRNLRLLVLDNRTTAMTGFQPHPGAFTDWSARSQKQIPEERASIEAIARACGVPVVETVDPYKPAEAVSALRRAFAVQGVSVVVMRSPCPQMAERARFLPRRPPVRILRERCRACGNKSAGRHCGMTEIFAYQAQRAHARLSVSEQPFALTAEGASPPLDTPPCTAACPAQICVQGYVGLLAARRFDAAYELLRKRIPFPAVCAFICPHPCEAACVFDRPVAIRLLKRMAVQFGYKPGIVRAGSETGRRVAIVGAGPSGLTAAEYLRRFGHAVTIFEAAKVPGGLLTQAIPTFRLPQDLVRREIDDILGLGVEIRLGTRVGRDLTLREIMNGYDATILAIGLEEGQGLQVPGAELEGVEDALSFLRRVAIGALEKIDGHVVVVGGGNTAIDAARTALRLGARSATVIYRRGRDEMPAFTDEVEAAQREGVKFAFLTNPVSFEGDNRKVCRVVCQKTRLGEPDSTGRRRPVPVSGSEFALEATRVLLAVGQVVGATSAIALDGLKQSNAGLPEIDPDTMMTSVRGLFACGDVTGGPASVIEAIHQGQAVASSVDCYLRAGEPRVAEGFRKPAIPNSEKWRGIARKVSSVVSGLEPEAWEARLATGALTEEQVMEMAKAEAARCLQCGTCANCRACIALTGCPALKWREGVGPEVISGLCNGCGLCAAVCPNGAIVSGEGLM